MCKADFSTLFSSLCNRQQAKFQLLFSNFYHFFPQQTTQQTHSQTWTAFRKEMVTVYFFPFLCCRVWLPRWRFYFTGQFSLFQKELFSLNLLLQRNVTCLGAANKAIFPIKFFPFLLISQNAFSVEPISKDLEKSVRFEFLQRPGQFMYQISKHLSTKRSVFLYWR